jgi:hypothetical protein
MPLSRISHTGDGKSDSTTCAWFVWDKTSTVPWMKVLMLGEDGQVAEENTSPLLLDF